MDPGHRKVPEREAHPVARPLDALDLPVRRARVRALVVAVLEDETSARGAADMVDRVEWRYGDRVVFGHRGANAISLRSIETIRGSASDWPSGMRGKIRCCVGSLCPRPRRSRRRSAR